MLSNYFIGIFVSFGAALCWGLVYAQVQTLSATIPTPALLALSYLVGGVILGPFAGLQLKVLAQKSLASSKDIFFCIAALLAAELLIFYSIRMLGGTDASLIEVSMFIIRNEYILLY